MTDEPAKVGLRERILRGDLLVGTFLNLGAPQGVELAGLAGLDWLLVDLEHGAGTEADLLPQLYAAETTGVPALVRVEVNARLRMGRALDLGAAGIMVPRLETPAEVRDAVSYRPLSPGRRAGHRAVDARRRTGAGRASASPREERSSCRSSCRSRIRRPSQHAAEIAAIDGVDVLFVGPTDLTHSLGVPGDFANPTYLDSLRRVVDAATTAGKEAGILLRRARGPRPPRGHGLPVHRRRIRLGVDRRRRHGHDARRAGGPGPIRARPLREPGGESPAA